MKCVSKTCDDVSNSCVYVTGNSCVCCCKGGTDIVGCFIGGCVDLPVYRGEIQCRLLGMAIESWNEDGV